jgi:hypothetical protein
MLAPGHEGGSKGIDERGDRDHRGQPEHAAIALALPAHDLDQRPRGLRVVPRCFNWFFRR